MHASIYRGRKAVSCENAHLRVTMTVEGGHIAEIFDKATGLNPLWTPPWPSIEPSTYSLDAHPEYGNDAESKLLAGIMGHNLCLDVFGPPSEEEAWEGMTVHGEASIAPYEITASDSCLVARAELPVARLRFQRAIQLEGRALHFTEILENLAPADHPTAWTQHVTLGPPFVEPGRTQFRAPVARSYSADAGAEFPWPHLPTTNGTSRDMRTYTSAPVSAAFTTHLMRESPEAYFFAFSPSSQMLLGYVWRRADFPWLGVWEENHARTQPPWNGLSLTWGMEFGVSPLPESRRKMISRNSMFGAPGYRWIPARSKTEVKYTAFLQPASSIPESLEEVQIDVSA
jgi:hypothetical protein